MLVATVSGLPLPGSIGNQPVFAPPSPPSLAPVASDIVVTTAADSGVGSLRWAIEQANAIAGANRITFNLNPPTAAETAAPTQTSESTEAAVFVIQPLSALPALTDTTGGTTIDGRSQARRNDSNPFGPEVVLDGSLLPNTNIPGIQIASGANNNSIIGLNIHSFPGDGISIIRANGNRVSGNYIGTDPQGIEARPNGWTTFASAGGVTITAGAKNNLIGTDADGVDDEVEANLIAGNHRHGVRLQQGAATDQTSNNIIRGNVLGRYGLGNEESGLLFIGGSAGGGVSANIVEQNIIVGNGGTDVRYQSLLVIANTVRDNIDSLRFDQLFGESFGLTPQEFLAAASAPTAEFEWSMEQRTGPNYVYDSDWADFPGQIPNVQEYVNPSDGYAVTLDASNSRARGTLSIQSYRWIIDGQPGQPPRREVTGVRPRLKLPEGIHHVTLIVTDSSGQSTTAEGEIFVNDILVVSMGDSYASGEGNPHDKLLTGIWAVGGDSVATAENQVAHRSIYSAPAQAAWLLEQNDPHTSVTFVSVAASGAGLTHLLYPHQKTSFEGHYIDNSSLYFEGDQSLASQLSQVKALTKIRGNGDSPAEFREIDRMFLSFGGNDVGFADIITGMLEDDYSAIFDVRGKLTELYDLFTDVDYAIHSELNIARENVFLTDYPDPTTIDSPSNTPDQMMDDVFELGQYTGFINEVSDDEIRLARNYVLHPLNSTLRQVAAQNRWTFVELQNSLWTHGYAADDNWIVTWNESVDRQGRDDNTYPKTMGVLHPNEKGSKAMAIEMARAAFGPTFESSHSPAPRVEEITTRIEVAAAPPVGTPWAKQTINIYFNGESSQLFDTGTEFATLAASMTFNREKPPVELRLDDISILAPDGSEVEVMGIRYVGQTLFQVDFRPTGYGMYLLSIGPEVTGPDGRDMDQDEDGISGYRSGAEQRDVFIGAVAVHTPGNAPRGIPASPPAQPAVGVDANGDTIGSIQQYATTAVSPGMTFPSLPGGDVLYTEPQMWGISFSAATINTFLRPTHVHEATGGIGLDEFARASGFRLPYSNTESDNEERAELIADEFSAFDIVAMQELFDPDQIQQLSRLATQGDYFHLNGPGPDSWGIWSVGTGAGLSLLVDRTLSDQADDVWDDNWLRMEYGDASPFGNGFGLRDKVNRRFQHDSVSFDYEGGGDDAKWANKGFTLDKVQVGSSADHFVYVVNTHLSAEKPKPGATVSQTRLQQISEIADYVSRNTDREHPVLFMGDFNVAAGTPEYDAMMKLLDHPLDPFLMSLDGEDYFTTDPSRNPYEYFERHTREGDPARVGGDKRIDYILIRQGTEFAIRVNSVKLEDGTDGDSSRLITDRMRKLGQHPLYEDYFSDDFENRHSLVDGTLIPYVSDHFGLSAQLVFEPQRGGPKVASATRVVNVSSNLEPTPSPMSYNPPIRSEFIEVEFDEPVLVGSFTPSDVQLIDPKLRAAAVLRVRPAHSSDQTLSRRFVVEFMPTTYGDYTLSIGPTIQDSQGNRMTNSERSNVHLRRGMGPVLAPSTGSNSQAVATLSLPIEMTTLPFSVPTGTESDSQSHPLSELAAMRSLTGNPGTAVIVADPRFESGKLLLVMGTSAADSLSVLATRQSPQVVRVMSGQRRLGEFARSEFDAIVVFGQDGNDLISVGRAIDCPAYLFGGNGRDTLNGGYGEDTIEGGTGRDLIRGGGGRDRIFSAGNGRFEVGNETIRVGVDVDRFAGIEEAILTGTSGDNSFDVSAAIISVNVHGGGGRDTVISSLDANYELADDRLIRTVGSVATTFALQGIHTAKLAGGPSDNTFDVSDWTGIALLDGGSGTDRLIAGGAHDFKLSESTLERSANAPIPPVSLVSIESAVLLGGAGDNTFTVSDWTKDARLEGGGGIDTVVSTNDADFELDDHRLARSTGGDFELLDIAIAQLYGGNSDNRIDASHYSGMALLAGGMGNDTLSGGYGHSVLVGADGQDTLRAGLGNSLLVGGGGSDSVFGSSADDVVIGGSTTDDRRLKSLQAVLMEWSATFDFSTMASKLKRLLRLDRFLIDDNSPDVIEGGGGMDWFAER